MDCPFFPRQVYVVKIDSQNKQRVNIYFGLIDILTHKYIMLTFLIIYDNSIKNLIQIQSQDFYGILEDARKNEEKVGKSGYDATCFVAK